MSKLPLPAIPPSLRGTLSQPASIAMAASVGIHGLLFVLLPMLPSNSFEPSDNEQRTVDLVELTPDELSRLPDLSTPETPDFPKIPDVQANDPSRNDLFRSPSTLSRIPQLSVPSSQPFFIPPYPPPIAIQPSVPRSITPSAPPTATPPSSPSPSPAQTPQPQQPTPNLGETRDLPELATIDPTVPLEGESIPVRPEESSAQPSETLMAEQAQLRELFTFNEEGTTNEEANIAYGTWFLEELGQQSGEPLKIPIKASYTVTACRILGRIQDDPKRLNAIYGVVVDPDGSLKGNPQLVRSSGFKYFNQQALEAIAQYDFSAPIPETGEDDSPEATTETVITAEGDRIYLVDVQFDYSEEICPAPALPAEEAPTG